MVYNIFIIIIIELFKYIALNLSGNILKCCNYKMMGIDNLIVILKI